MNIDLVRIALRRKLHLAVIIVSALVLGFVFSSEWFITPKYKSSAILYPSNLIPYSMETPTEQLLQLFQSADVRTMMVKRFELSKHYRVDTTAKAGQTALFMTYDENVSIRKTEFESVKIDVLDEDPSLAKSMVDSLIHFVNLKARNLQREKTREVVAIFKNQLTWKKKQMDSLGIILGELRVRYGLLDYKSQTKEVTKAYLKLIGGNSTQARGIDSLLRHLEEKGGELVTASELLDKTRNDYSNIKAEYDKALSDLSKELTYSNVVTKPYKADKKSYPVRWVIMLTFAVSSIVLAMFLFAILDRRERPAESASQNNTNVG
ncbi:MAG: exopolysaccharide biosynthesis protein [Bacteroidetes bacterium]|nr:MAG: exopolysaccharide biosynthesis protein [Bacteroidota bacterium]